MGLPDFTRRLFRRPAPAGHQSRETGKSEEEEEVEELVALDII
jgi:hypothetical protein